MIIGKIIKIFGQKGRGQSLTFGSGLAGAAVGVDKVVADALVHAGHAGALVHIALTVLSLKASRAGTAGGQRGRNMEIVPR